MSARANAGSKILRNSFWYGLETVIETVVFLGASIAVARHLGPTELGYYSFINLLVTVVTRTSGSGLAGVTRKFMSDSLAVDKLGTAHAVYRLAFRYQMLGSVLITVLGLAGVLLFDRQSSYQLVSCVLIASIVPGVMSWVPAEANNAFEDAAKNTQSAFGYLVSYVVVIVLTIYLGWGLVGVASATLVGRTVEVFLRTIPLNKKLRTMPLDTLDDGLVADLRRYCLEAIGVQLLMTIAFDRSEIFFLRIFSQPEQIAFYSISFSLANNLLIIPRILTTATGMSLMVESARDPARVDSLVRNSCRYLLLFVFPVHLGAAAIAAQAIRFVYGPRYAEAGLVLVVAAITSIPRAFQDIPNYLMRSGNKQKQLFVLIGVTGAINLLLDWYLIPRYNAVGAAWANGIAQAVGIVAIWLKAKQAYTFGFPKAIAARLGFAGVVMGAVAAAVSYLIHGLPGLIAAVIIAAPTYVLMVRLVHGLEPADQLRLEPIGNKLPSVARPWFAKTIAFATPARASTSS